MSFRSFYDTTQNLEASILRLDHTLEGKLSEADKTYAFRMPGEGPLPAYFGHTVAFGSRDVRDERGFQQGQRN
jgi:hypothetical protein